MEQTLNERLEELDQRISETLKESVIHIREVYYLNNWYRYRKNLKELSHVEAKNAIVLFKALKELPESEREFLSAKYNRHKRIKDESLADLIGVELKDYRRARRRIQKKLKTIMQQQKLEEL